MAAISVSLQLSEICNKVIEADILAQDGAGDVSTLAKQLVIAAGSGRTVERLGLALELVLRAEEARLRGISDRRGGVEWSSFQPQIGTNELIGEVCRERYRAGREQEANRQAALAACVKAPDDDLPGQPVATTAEFDEECRLVEQEYPSIGGEIEQLKRRLSEQAPRQLGIASLDLEDGKEALVPYESHIAMKHITVVDPAQLTLF